jgi:hypothetical protein
VRYRQHDESIKALPFEVPVTRLGKPPVKISATYERPSSARKQAAVESCGLSQEINFVNFGMMIFVPACNAVSDPT